MQNSLMRIAMYSVVLNIFFVPFNGTIASIFGYLEIICIVIYPWFSSLKSGRIKIDLCVFLFICLFLLSMIFSIDYFALSNLMGNALSLCSFLAFYWTLSLKNGNSRLHYRDLFRMNYLLTFVLLLFAFGPFSFKYSIIQPYGVRVFNMGLGNPNSVAVYVMFTCVVLLIHILKTKHFLVKTLDVFLLGALLYVLIQLQSRTVLFCSLAVVLYFVVRPRKKVGRFFPYMTVLLPMAMIPVQLIIGKVQSSISILGKSLATGRASIYENLLSEYIEAPLKFIFGCFFQYPFTNMHNAPLSIFATAGIIGVLLSVVFWVKQIKIMNAKADSTVQKVAFVSVLAYLIHSSSEAMSMIGTIPYCMFVLLCVKLAKGEFVD